MYIFGVYFFSCKSVWIVLRKSFNNLEQYVLKIFRLLEVASFTLSKVAVMNVEFQQLYTGITSFSKDMTQTNW